MRVDGFQPAGIKINQKAVEKKEKSAEARILLGMGKLGGRGWRGGIGGGGLGRLGFGEKTCFSLAFFLFFLLFGDFPLVLCE